MPTRKLPDHVYADGPRVSRDQAVEFLAHHLSLAAMFFECTPDDFGETRAEVLRILGDADDERAVEAAEAFLDAINVFYERTKADERKAQGL